MINRLCELASRPELYAPGDGNIWEDEHISKGLLSAHLDTQMDAASRGPAFMDRSVRWIGDIAPVGEYPELIDLGCGPGLYAERFCAAGYTVTGVDISERSLDYARAQAAANGSGIRYVQLNYLDLDYVERFDVATIIYCDYAALSKADRQRLLTLVLRALKRGGKLIFDVFTPANRSPEGRSWYCSEQGGFWSEVPHLCLNSVYQYDDDDSTELRQTIVCTQTDIKCYNVWDHFFTGETLEEEIRPMGFSRCEFFGDAAGAEFSPASDTLCAVLTK